MKFSCHIEIDADRPTVWAAFDNRDNIRRWQPEIRSIEVLSGERHQRGAVSRIVYREGGREHTIVEEITERREPDLIALRGETVADSATSVSHFEDLGDARTRWSMYVNHSFSGWMRLVGPFFRKASVRRTEGHMQRFKLMVESDLKGGLR